MSRIAVLSLSLSALLTVGLLSAPAAWAGADATQGELAVSGGSSAADRTQWARSRSWAMRPQIRKARQCRSGNDYRRANGNGDYGAYQLTRKAWRKRGGLEFARTPDRATRSEQNLVAWRKWRDNPDSVTNCREADWMADLYPSAPRTPLGQMVIPGSHDSGSSRIDGSAPCKKGLIAGLPGFFELANRTNPCMVAQLAKSQQRNLGTQLKGGVRYLDLRVGVPADKVVTRAQAGKPPRNPAGVPLVLHHNAVSQPLIKGLRQIQRYTRAHPREQVILDFQHIDLTGDATIDSYYKKALDGILRTYAPSGTKPVCRTAWSDKIMGSRDARIADVPVRRAWRKGRSLVVLFPKGEMPDRSCYRNRDRAIISLWPNTDDPATSESANLQWLRTREQRLAGSRSGCIDADGNWCGLFVSQSQLTNTTATQATCIFDPKSIDPKECSLQHLAELVNDSVAKNVPKWRLGKDLPMNIVMIDYVDESVPSLSRQAITTNWKVIDGK